MGEIKVHTGYIELSTKGSIDIINITQNLEKELINSGIYDGILTVFVPGATGAVATIECEEGLIIDTKEMFLELIKENKNYHHNKSHAQGNATSHLRATLIGPSLTIPITDGKLQRGIWQEVVFIEFDNRPRKRQLIVKILGTTKK